MYLVRLGPKLEEREQKMGEKWSLLSRNFYSTRSQERFKTEYLNEMISCLVPTAEQLLPKKWVNHGLSRTMESYLEEGRLRWTLWYLLWKEEERIFQKGRTPRTRVP